MQLEMNHIKKVYGTLLANDDISISVKAGEVLAIVGENGAGKSTLMRILYGIEQPTAGEITIDGKRVDISSPTQAIANKIGMVQQHFMLFSNFTTTENIIYGGEPRKGFGGQAGKGPFFDKKGAEKVVCDLCERYKLYVDPTHRMGDCTVGIQQRVEILKVLYQDAQLIIFDEPTAVLTPQEIGDLLKTIRVLADSGRSIILITHKLAEVMEVADRVVVLRGGKQISTLDKKDTTMEELSYLMVGRQLARREITPPNLGDAVLELKELLVKSEDGKCLLDHISLSVRSGEVVGIAGVSGNGQSELIQVITGLISADGGKVEICGADMTNRPVREIREGGCSVVPEDRYLWGTSGQATVSETALMGYQNQATYQKKGFLKVRNVAELTWQMVRQFGVKVGSIRQKASELSGGNLQKLIVAREMTHNSPFLLVAEPTRGIDVGAIEFIHKQILSQRGEGRGILLISSELSEVMSLSDRILVMYNGRIQGEVSRAEATEEKLGLMMAGGKRNVC
ncbi:ABC transporter ATP-binding protein [Oscillospiraceae bacterium MB08-C2-2]|nr:ABC transporter ATP-binding protein [Oscillospiraceae bacterium MB08-C2-2]